MLLWADIRQNTFFMRYGKFIQCAWCSDLRLVFNIHVGAWQALSRAMLTELIPKGKEAEFFSLYEITDKGSAWVGPLLTALVRDWTGDFRNSFWVLIAMLVVAIPLLRNVDMDKGRIDVAHCDEEGEIESQDSTDSTTKILV
eukprot:NODE_406_length_9252_cov_0.363269.p5 type:complete len:142 gc:universal NODE_406_length_9252_cov_0.363269:7757-7332(-)